MLAVDCSVERKLQSANTTDLRKLKGKAKGKKETGVGLHRLTMTTLGPLFLSPKASHFPNVKSAVREAT